MTRKPNAHTATERHPLARAWSQAIPTPKTGSQQQACKSGGDGYPLGVTGGPQSRSDPPYKKDFSAQLDFWGFELVEVEPGTEITCEVTGRVNIVTDSTAVSDGKTCWVTAAGWAMMRAYRKHKQRQAKRERQRGYGRFRALGRDI